MSINFTELSEFYVDHLKTVLLPFWLSRAIDHEYGGVYTCFDNTGEKLLSTDKYVWSQGRVVWMFSKLSTMDIFTSEERAQFLEIARKTGEFIMEHAMLENGHCSFLLARDGTPKPMNPGDPLDLGPGADSFAMLGLIRYAGITGDEKSFNFAKKIFNNLKNRPRDPNAKVFPYPPVQGYKGPPMEFLLNATEFALTMKRFGDPQSDEMTKNAAKCIETILYDFPDENLSCRERKTLDNKFDNYSLIGRYVNPGHTIEDMWFVMHEAMRQNNRKAVERAGDIIKRTFEIGWDKEYGGIFLFVDNEGGQPKGSIEGLEHHVMVHKVLNDWSNKLWWPHSEALYTTLLAYKLLGDEEFLKLYEKVHEYTFRTFPNPNKEIGEWIQIRDRQGNPENKIVALPVKDPFHIIRNFILVINLLQKPELIF